MSARRIGLKADMHVRSSTRRVVAAVAAAGCCAALAACGSSASGSMSQMRGKATTNAAATSTGSMKGMQGMQGMSGSGKAVDGIKPIPTQMLASASWQDMSIQARAMTPVPFVIFNGHKEQLVKPPKHTSFHLMVMLDDARSHYPIPYASVWATFKRNGKVVYDERQWPMLSEYLGPHYGNNVHLPGPGRYQLSLLISPPVSARHMEYAHVWTKPHRVDLHFTWKGNS